MLPGPSLEWSWKKACPCDARQGRAPAGGTGAPAACRRDHLQHSTERCRHLLGQKVWSPEQLERLESFTSRFARLADLLTQRVFRLIDDIELIGGGSVLDRIYRAEKRGWVEAAQLIRVRELRNLIAHEYATEKMPAIHAAVAALAPILLATVHQFTAYADGTLRKYASWPLARTAASLPGGKTVTVYFSLLEGTLWRPERTPCCRLGTGIQAECRRPARSAEPEAARRPLRRGGDRDSMRPARHGNGPVRLHNGPVRLQRRGVTDLREPSAGCASRAW